MCSLSVVGALPYRLVLRFDVVSGTQNMTSNTVWPWSQHSSVRPGQGTHEQQHRLPSGRHTATASQQNCCQSPCTRYTRCIPTRRVWLTLSTYICSSIPDTKELIALWQCAVVRTPAHTMFTTSSVHGKMGYSWWTRARHTKGGGLTCTYTMYIRLCSKWACGWSSNWDAQIKKHDIEVQRPTEWRHGHAALTVLWHDLRGRYFPTPWHRMVLSWSRSLHTPMGSYMGR